MPDSERIQETQDGDGQRFDRGQAMLLDFLREHDATCPVCGYNVRGLTRPICPECKQDLVLTVGVKRLRLGWLFAAVAPGFFSGIAACFVAIPTTGVYIEDGLLITPLVWAVSFGWLSGIFAVVLARKRNRTRFLAASHKHQWWMVFLIWLVHIAAFGLFIILMAAHI